MPKEKMILYQECPRVIEIREHINRTTLNIRYNMVKDDIRIKLALDQSKNNGIPRAIEKFSMPNVYDICIDNETIEMANVLYEQTRKQDSSIVAINFIAMFIKKEYRKKGYGTAFAYAIGMELLKISMLDSCSNPEIKDIQTTLSISSESIHQCEMFHDMANMYKDIQLFKPKGMTCKIKLDARF